MQISQHCIDMIFYIMNVESEVMARMCFLIGWLFLVFASAMMLLEYRENIVLSTKQPQQCRSTPSDFFNLMDKCLLVLFACRVYLVLDLADFLLDLVDRRIE